MTFSSTFSSFPGHDLRSRCHLKKFAKVFFCFKVFFDLKRFNRNKLWCSPKREQFALLNYYSLSYIALALSSAVTSLSKITLIFHATFKDWQLLNSMTFQAWKMNLLNFKTFQVFHDLYEPWYSFAYFSLLWWIIYLKLKINPKQKKATSLVHAGSCKAYEVAWIASTINNYCSENNFAANHRLYALGFYIFVRGFKTDY